MMPECHRAGWIMVRPGIWIENGVVEIVRGRITTVGRFRPGTLAFDHGPGVIMSALVNAHTHLSLSNLGCRITQGLAFVDWVKEIIRQRECSSPGEVAAAAGNAADAVRSSGTGLVAEVGPIDPGSTVLKRSGLEGIIFSEILGQPDVLPGLPDSRNGLVFSYAGHALHTTAPDVLTDLKHRTDSLNTPFSIHLAESEAEVEFLAGATGEWSELLVSRGIDFSGWDLRNERPIPRADRLGLLGPGTLAVHALQVDADDVAILANKGVAVCVCPRSNLVLHGQLPDIDGLLSAGLLPAFGTDSLASVPISKPL